MPSTRHLAGTRVCSQSGFHTHLLEPSRAGSRLDVVPMLPISGDIAAHVACRVAYGTRQGPFLASGAAGWNTVFPGRVRGAGQSFTRVRNGYRDEQECNPDELASEGSFSEVVEEEHGPHGQAQRSQAR